MISDGLDAQTMLVDRFGLRLATVAVDVVPPWVVALVVSRRTRFIRHRHRTAAVVVGTLSVVVDT